MLHHQGWKCCKKGINWLVLVSFVLVVAGCNNRSSLVASEEEEPIFSFENKDLFKAVSVLSSNRGDTLVGDGQLRKYYASDNTPLWVSPYGVSSAADSLLDELSDVEKEGLSRDVFCADTLQKAISKIRRSDFAAGEDTMKIFAEVEYWLTQSYLRYVAGQRYGFVNPRRMHNRIDKDKKDAATGRVRSYKMLFDIDIERPDSVFYATALSKITESDIKPFISSVRPQTALYKELCSLLNDTTYDRKALLCNIERCRWRGYAPTGDDNKYVAVNLPAYHLYAHNGDSVLDMKIGCGTFRNKTPQLVSKISWMEVNPVWIIPKSIIENEVSPHAGDSAYFARNRYSVIDKATGDTVATDSTLTRRMLKSGKYKIVQKGGVGNSLGRIVFRFKNNLSIYLHDTSTKAFFKRERRGVSHGCVRIEKPFDFAAYLLETDDEWLLDKIRISMDIKPETDKGKKFMKEHRENNGTDDDLKLVKRRDVEPQVPLHIIYYTVFTDEKGEMKTYPDIYGYDKILWEHIKPLAK